MKATHRDSRWITDFVVALRAREVPGRRIGDLVAEVEEFCAESGEDPQAAFGRPEVYAAERAAEGPDGRTGAAGWAASLAPTVAGVAGLALLLPSLVALRHGRSVDVAWGMLVVLVVLALVCVALIRWLDLLLRHRAAFVASFVAAFMAMFLLPIVLHATAFTMPAPAGLGAAVLLLAVSVVGARTWARVGEDPVVDPATGADRYASERSLAGTAAGLSTRAQGWGLAVVAVALGALVWFAG